MRICVVCLELGVPREGIFIGGVVNSVVRLCQGLSKTGNKITIVTTPPRQHSSLGNMKTEWADIYPISVRGSYPSMLYGLEFTIRALWRIMKLHKDKKFDIIVSHSAYPAVGLIPGIAGRLLGIPSIHTLYCPIEQKNSAKGINKLPSTPKLSKGCLSQVNMIIGLSQNVKTSLTEIGLPPGKIKVLPPSVELETFNPSVSGKQSRARLGIDESAPLILFVGNLTRQKGTHVALEAMYEVIKLIPQAKLVMTSELPSKFSDMLRREVEISIERFGLQGNVIQVGITNNMAELMVACDMLIAPFLSIRGISDYPLPILEAMAVGRPVIATKVGGIPEVVKDMQNGVLIEPGDSSSLSNAIINLCEQRELRQMLGENASVFISNKFSIDKIAKLMEMVYEEVAAYEE